MAEPGRPKYDEKQYEAWLEEMRPHLVLGCSLNKAMEKAGLMTHEWSIREKYRSGDWFSRKIDTFRSTPGEAVNEALVRISMRALDRIKRDEVITKEEFDTLKLMAEKHRTSQPFFVDRKEEAKADDSKLGKIIDDLDNEGEDYEDVAGEAQKQVVAANAPVQDQGQAGAASNVQAQPDSAQAPSGEAQTPA